MNLVRTLSRKLGQWTSGVAFRLALVPWLERAQAFLSFALGQGGASGWNVARETRAVASVVVADKPVIFDIGANNGEWSLRLSRQLPKEAHFYLFECAPYCFEGIEKRRIPNARLFRCAVSAEDGRATLHLPTEGSGLASLHERKDVSVRRMEYLPLPVETRSIDSISAEIGIDYIDLLKIDIEGHEIFALRGAKRMIEERRIGNIIFEFGSANVNSRTHFREFWDLLTESGYSILRFLPSGKWYPVKQYTESLEYFRGASLYLGRMQNRNLSWSLVE